MVIAVVADNSIFTPSGLNTVAELSNIMGTLPNIDPEGITSIATENNIVGTLDGMLVEPFFEGEVSDQIAADKVRSALQDFPLYQGSLVAKDGTATLLVLEMLDDGKAEQTYQHILDKLRQYQIAEGYTLYVAGEGAISGYLGSYIDADAKRLNPLAALVITIIVFVAFRRVSATVMANVIIAASLMLTVGIMALVEVPFYVITNALPVILIGIAVADTIHIYSEYFERRAKHPEENTNDAIVNTMEEMWRPITLTTLTTVAGFLGLYFAAYMPPFKYFGLFTALGVVVAWAYSLLLLPAAMTLLKTPVHKRFTSNLAAGKKDIFSLIMQALGVFTQKYAKGISIFSLFIVVAGVISAVRINVDENRIETFHPEEPLYKADRVINNKFDGTNYIDVVIETEEAEGIFSPHVLNKMEALQVYAETLPYVNGSTSIVDYLKQMNRSLNEGNSLYYVLPQDQDLIAQYFLLYSTSAEPTDFEEEVDYDYRLANIRLSLSSGAFSDNKQVIETLERYINDGFNDRQVSATLSGRVNLSYHWIKDLGTSHFKGMAIALFLVWLVSALLFRSSVAGVYALIPVATSILLVYSSMVLFDIHLGIGTSMFAAVAIGLGVDFAIHTIDRVKHLYSNYQDLGKTLQHFYPTTGRALFFNLLAIALGFGVLISSKVVPLNNFGLIVALSVTTSFLVSMVLLPALLLVFKPRFIVKPKSEYAASGVLISKGTFVTATFITLIYLAGQSIAFASPTLSGLEIAKKVNSVDEGVYRTSKLTMKMIDRNGKSRTRETRSYREYFGEEKRTVLFYLSPRNVKNTGFLTYDYPQPDIDDDQWLYLPALRKARRISASDRGDYFLGTDFTYEDIKKEGKFELSDFNYQFLGEVVEGAETLLQLQIEPVSDKVARELGYGKALGWVNPDNWILVKVQYWDVNLNRLKTLTVSDIRKVDGIWTRHKLQIDNHKTGHYSEFVFSDVDYKQDIKDSVFTRQSLTRGAPK